MGAMTARLPRGYTELVVAGDGEMVFVNVTNGVIEQQLASEFHFTDGADRAVAMLRLVAQQLVNDGDQVAVPGVGSVYFSKTGGYTSLGFERCRWYDDYKKDQRVFDVKITERGE